MSTLKLKGYNSTRCSVPLKVQNLVIRDYCERNGHVLLLPNTEFVMPDTYMILKSMKDVECDGLVAYSMFLAPEKLWSEVNKEVHFALEGYVYPNDRENCRVIWALRRD